MKLADCPAALPAEPALTPIAPNVIMLPDGRRAVLLELVRDRSKVTADYIVLLRDGLRRCQSAVRYVAEWREAAK